MTPEANPRPSPIVVGLSGLTLLALVGLVLLRLSAYGIWDPWELTVADSARKLAEGASSDGGPVSLGLRLVGAGFSMFGVREWAGRLPMALSGLGLLAITLLLALRFAGPRVALYAAVALGTTPFFLLHSRQMVGGTPAMLGSALVMWGAMSAAYPARTPSSRTFAPYAWLIVAIAGGVLGTFAAGAMLTVVPPLGAVALVALLRADTKTSEAGPRRVALWVVVLAAVVIAWLVIRAVLRHAAEPSLLLGGAPIDPAVPPFERTLEHLFHGFAPWSALFPLALASLMREEVSERSDAPLRLACMLWASLAYAAHTLFLSSYGTAPYSAGPALAIAAAFWLADRDEDASPHWAETVIAVMFVGLAIRDFALYPSTPFNSLEIADAKAPEVFNPKRAWALVLGAFAGALVLASMASRAPRSLDLRAPYRGVRDAWKKSWPHRVWLVLAALCLLGLLAFGVVAWIDPSAAHLTSLARRIGRVLAFVPPGILVGVAAGQVAYVLAGKLAALRHAPLVAAALLVGGYTSQVFLPALSEHLSPRDVFDTYNDLAKPGEPLAQHHVEGRAAAYYAQGDVREIGNRTELIDFLAAPSRRWAAFPSDQLADIDLAFRKRAGRHLFVPRDDNGRVTLAANEPVQGHENQNPLAKYVLSEAPKVEHPVNARFEDAIELIGYDLDLPAGSSVGPGQSFTITWVWRALRANIGTYKVFLHIDSGSQRINGDHDPVDGTYPVRLWDVGDVVLDRQEIAVPATSPPGVYTMYIGFFRGESRLRLQQGENDGVDRLRAGTVRVR